MNNIFDSNARRRREFRCIMIGILSILLVVVYSPMWLPQRPAEEPQVMTLSQILETQSAEDKYKLAMKVADLGNYGNWLFLADIYVGDDDAQTVALLESAAEELHRESISALGSIYFLGGLPIFQDGREQYIYGFAKYRSIEKALPLLHQASDMGDVISMRNLGKLYSSSEYSMTMSKVNDGETLDVIREKEKRRIEQACYWLTLAKSKGDIRASRDLAWVYYRFREKSLWLEEMDALVAQKYIPAFILLGFEYAFKGTGLPMKGKSDGIRLLKEVYECAKDLEPTRLIDSETGMSYDRASYILSVLGLLTEIVDQDKGKALVYYQEFMKRNSHLVSKHVGLTGIKEAAPLYRMTVCQEEIIRSSEIPDSSDVSALIESYQLSLEKGCPYAAYRIGRIYEYGFGVPKDEGLARKNYLVCLQQLEERNSRCEMPLDEVSKKTLEEIKIILKSRIDYIEYPWWDVCYPVPVWLKSDW